MIKRIHVNQHNIKANAKGCKRPVLSVKTYKETKVGNEIAINGPSRVVYNDLKPLSCGARVWIETESDVYIDGIKIT